MSLKDCITNLKNAGELSPAEAVELSERYDALARQLFSPAKARAQLIADLEAEQLEKRRRTLLTEKARQAAERDVIGYSDGRGEADPGEGLMMLLENFGQARYGDVENGRLAILGMAHAKLDTLLDQFRKGAITGDKRRGFGQTAARLDNVVRELFGTGTGDTAAKGFAAAWRAVAEDLRQRFNAAGGAIGKLEQWGLPQLHDPAALLAYGRDRWVGDLIGALDRERMTSPLTGAVMTDDDLRRSLTVVWERVTSNGWFDRDPTGTAGGRGALFRQHADHRFLHFKDADAWLRYQKNFGQGDPYAAMMGYVNTMTRDIAILERLGPNPKAMLDYLTEVVQKRAAGVTPAKRVRKEQREHLHALARQWTQAAPRADAISARIGDIISELDSLRRKRVGPPSPRTKTKMTPLRAELTQLQSELEGLRAGTAAETPAQREIGVAMQRLLAEMRDEIPFVPGSDPKSHADKKLKRAHEMFNLITGASNTPVNAMMANGLAGVRNIVGAATLGMAPISAISDQGTQAMTRAFIGMPVANQLASFLKAFTRADRKLATRAGLILDQAVGVMTVQARYVGAIDTRSKTGFIADRVHTFSGLTPMTQAAKHAFGLDFQGWMADHAQHVFKELPEPMRRMLDRHGFAVADWDAIRAAEIYEFAPGGTLLRPSEIEATAGRALAERYLMMLYKEQRHAVIESTVRGRTAFISDTQPGTLAGEMIRSAAMLKSFPTTFMMMHAGRAFREVSGGRALQAAQYAGGLLIVNTLLGGAAIQLKELAQGRDAQEMSDPNFWGRAFLQGGGLGIFGDFMVSNVNRFGGGLSSTLAGPLVERANTLRNLTIGNVAQLAGDEPTNAGRESVTFLRQNTPGGSIWWLRAAYERIVLDQLQHLIDPGARAVFRRKMQTRKKDYGNAFWWRPGEAAPARGPGF